MAREMKNSDIEWIGEIPAEWNIRKGKWILKKLERQVEKSDGVITCFRDGEVTLRSNRREEGFTFSLQEDGYQGIESGDLVVHGMDGFAGAIGISDSRGKGSPVLNVMDSIQDKRYIMYYLRNMAYNGVFLALATGIRVRSCDTNWNKLKNLPYLVPALEEQKGVADYLDKKIAEIDAVIEKTKATIEEYKALKQSIITEAVTKGIRGDRPMKDSGIEWIGEIPADWEVSRLKNLAIEFSKGNGITKEDIIPDGDSPCVRYGEIYTKYNQAFTECHTRTNKALVGTPKYFSYGDLLFTCTGELVEEIGKSIVYLGEGKCLAGGDIVVLRHLQHPAFLNYSMNSTYAQAQKSCNKTKLKVVHISASDIGNVILAVPSISEQEEIANYLDKKCAEIDTLIVKKTALLEQMENYKKSVIYEYVTGKKEVS